MNIPNFLWLDRKYRDEMISLWVWIPTRSYAVIFQPDNNPGEADRWHLADFKKYKQIISQFTDIQKIYNLVSKHKCFFDMVQFPKVPEDIYQDYLVIRQQRTFKENAASYVDQKELAKILVYNIKTNWEQLQEQVKNGRFNKPTYRIITDTLFKDPITKKNLLQFQTIRNWATEILDKVPIEQKPVIEDLEDGNDNINQ